MTIDWTKPIELATEPPRPARVVEGPDSDDHYYVSADWPDGCYGRCDGLFVFRDGSVVADDYGEYPRVRNVAGPDLAAELATELAEALREIDRRYTAWLAASPKRDVPGVKPGTIRNMGRIARAALAKYEAQEKAK